MIPKLLHQLWMGTGPVPEQYELWSNRLRELHPDWEYRLWTDEHLEDLGCADLLLNCPPIIRSEVIRLYAMLRYGGVYVDRDCEPLKPLDWLTEQGYQAFAASEANKPQICILCNAVFGAIPHHPWIQHQIDLLPEYVRQPPPWGPTLMTRVSRDGVTVVPQEFFYPWLGGETGERIPKPTSFLVHHWAAGWREQPPPSKPVPFPRRTMPDRFTFHYLGMPHLPLTREYSACAFTQKIHKLARMLTSAGHRVFVYGVGYTDLKLPNFDYIPCATMEDVRGSWGLGDDQFEIGYDHAVHGFRHDLGSDPKAACTLKFRENAIREIRRRVSQDHFLLLSQGCYHKPIADSLALYLTCESGIGYRGSYAPFRAFESEYIRSFAYGSGSPWACLNGSYYDRVIPNYFDLDDFEFSPWSRTNDYGYIGRLISRKGVQTAAGVAKALGRKLLVAGQGSLKDVGLDSEPHVAHVGTLGVAERKKFLASCQVGFAPTIYLEPFGGTAVEWGLSGTPVLTTNFGAFPDTVRDGVNGFRCDTLDDFVQAAAKAQFMDRSKARQWAEQFSMQVVGQQFEKWWRDLYQLYLSTLSPHVKGWHHVRPVECWRFPEDVRGWLTANEGQALAQLARGKRVLEIGSYCGRSTICLAQSAEHVTALDWFKGDRGDEDTLAEFQANLRAYGVASKVQIAVGRSEIIGPTLGKYDVVFVDAAHDTDSVTKDLVTATQHLLPNGVIVLHDWDQESVRAAAHAVLGQSLGTTIERLHW